MDNKQRAKLLSKASDKKRRWIFPKWRWHLQDLFVLRKRTYSANLLSSDVRIQKQNKICFCCQVLRDLRSLAGTRAAVQNKKVANPAHCDTRGWDSVLWGEDEATTVGWMGRKVHAAYRGRARRVGYWNKGNQFYSRKSWQQQLYHYFQLW